jgi:DNA-binding MarR family transcriptional regulator
LVELQQSPPAAGIALGREFSTSVVLFQEAIAAKLGLNATDYRCLELILRKGEMTAKALAEELRLTTGAITGIVDHLEKAGYLERLENPDDRRSVIIRPLITERALEKKLGDVMISYRAAMSKLFAKYSKTETAAIVDFLNEFAKVLRAQTSRIRDA